MSPIDKSTESASLLTIALFQPDIPQNTGTILRMAACFDLHVAIIEPAGFPTSDRAFRRAGMDYLDSVSVARHASWQAFEEQIEAKNQRLVLCTTRGENAHHRFTFRRGDVLLFGRETDGVPEDVHRKASHRIRIPISARTRSLNLAVSAAIISAEAMRQIDAFPARTP